MKIWIARYVDHLSFGFTVGKLDSGYWMGIDLIIFSVIIEHAKL